jgi:Arc/MetJ family transcription regulator
MGRRSSPKPNTRTFDAHSLRLGSVAPKLSPERCYTWCWSFKVRATVSLDDELLQKAQQYSGVSERTALLREALKALIEREASRSLAALEGTMPDIEKIRRLRVDDL